jgi:hypothetical protein
VLDVSIERLERDANRDLEYLRFLKPGVEEFIDRPSGYDAAPPSLS